MSFNEYKNSQYWMEQKIKKSVCSEVFHTAMLVSVFAGSLVILYCAAALGL